MRSRLVAGGATRSRFARSSASACGGALSPSEPRRAIVLYVEPSYVFRPPQPRLRPFLTDLCGVHFAGTESTSTMVPDVSAAIVVHASSHDAPPTIAVRGPRTRTSRFARSTLRWALGVQLRVGHARAVLGVPLGALADEQVDLSELWPCDHLREALAKAKGMGERLSLLETEIAERLALGDHSESTSRIVERAAEALGSEPSRGIEQIARDLGISARQLRRRFLDVVGVGPKEYAATRRFLRAVDALALGRPLARVVLDAGYYDQAHMNLDFRARAGVSPKAWIAAQE